MLECRFCGRGGFLTIKGLTRHTNEVHPDVNGGMMAFGGTDAPVLAHQEGNSVPAGVSAAAGEDGNDTDDSDRFNSYFDMNEDDPSPIQETSNEPTWDADWWMQHVMEPDTVGVPEEISKHFFQAPSDFGSGYLLSVAGTKDSVKFAVGEWRNLTPETKSNVDLLKILKGKNLSLFDEIQRWKYRTDRQYQSSDLVDDKSITTREKVLKHLREVYGYDHIYPAIKQVTLPKTGAKVDLVVFPFGQMFLSLLTDPVAMQPENLLIDFDDPFKKPTLGGADGYLDDFNTGQVHVDAHQRYCTEVHDILCQWVFLWIKLT